jgi:tetratricopeptide (TPR) repeat protein
MAKKKNIVDNKLISNKDKEEKHDIFIDFSNKAILWIEKNRKLVLTGLSTILLLIIMVVVLIFYYKGQNIKLADLYYEATTQNVISNINNLRDKSGKVYPDEKSIANMKSGFEKLLNTSGDSIYSYLSQYNMGVIYYSLRDYKKSNEYFNKAAEGKNFVFAGEAIYNFANGFMNIGYEHYTKGEYDKALKPYEAAYRTYDRVIKEYPNSSIVPLAMESRGLVKEYMARCYLGLNQKDKAKAALKESKKYYNEYIKGIKKSFSDSLSKEYSTNVKTAVRRVNIKIKQIEN